MKTKNLKVLFAFLLIVPLAVLVCMNIFAMKPDLKNAEENPSAAYEGDFAISTGISGQIEGYYEWVQTGDEITFYVETPENGLWRYGEITLAYFYFDNYDTFYMEGSEYWIGTHVGGFAVYSYAPDNNGGQPYEVSVGQITTDTIYEDDSNTKLLTFNVVFVDSVQTATFGVNSISGQYTITSDYDFTLENGVWVFNVLVGQYSNQTLFSVNINHTELSGSYDFFLEPSAGTIFCSGGNVVYLNGDFTNPAVSTDFTMKVASSSTGYVNMLKFRIKTMDPQIKTVNYYSDTGRMYIDSEDPVVMEATITTPLKWAKLGVVAGMNSGEYFTSEYKNGKVVVNLNSANCTAGTTVSDHLYFEFLNQRISGSVSVRLSATPTVTILDAKTEGLDDGYYEDERFYWTGDCYLDELGFLRDYGDNYAWEIGETFGKASKYTDDNPHVHTQIGSANLGDGSHPFCFGVYGESRADAYVKTWKVYYPNGTEMDSSLYSVNTNGELFIDNITTDLIVEPVWDRYAFTSQYYINETLFKEYNHSYSDDGAHTILTATLEDYYACGGSGYAEFDGWYLDENFTTPVDVNTTIDMTYWIKTGLNPITLYAKFNSYSQTCITENEMVSTLIYGYEESKGSLEVILKDKNGNDIQAALVGVICIDTNGSANGSVEFDNAVYANTITDIDSIEQDFILSSRYYYGGGMEGINVYLPLDKSVGTYTYSYTWQDQYYPDNNGSNSLNVYVNQLDIAGAVVSGELYCSLEDGREQHTGVNNILEVYYTGYSFHADVIQFGYYDGTSIVEDLTVGVDYKVEKIVTHGYGAIYNTTTDYSGCTRITGLGNYTGRLDLGKYRIGGYDNLQESEFNVSGVDGKSALQKPVDVLADLKITINRNGNNFSPYTLKQDVAYTFGELTHLDTGDTYSYDDTSLLPAGEYEVQIILNKDHTDGQHCGQSQLFTSVVFESFATDFPTDSDGNYVLTKTFTISPKSSWDLQRHEGGIYSNGTTFDGTDYIGSPGLLVDKSLNYATLTENVDYYIEYYKSYDATTGGFSNKATETISVGSYYMKVIGMGNYTSDCTAYVGCFGKSARSLSEIGSGQYDDTLDLIDVDGYVAGNSWVWYNKQPHTLDVTLNYKIYANGITGYVDVTNMDLLKLEYRKDDVVYTSCTDVGIYEVWVVPNSENVEGEYDTGIELQVCAWNMSDLEYEYENEFVYDGNPHYDEPVVKIPGTDIVLSRGDDYSLIVTGVGSYEYQNPEQDCVEPGTYYIQISSNSNNFTGSVTLPFIILASEMENTKVELYKDDNILSNDNKYIYDGLEHKPTVKVINGTKELVEGTDYTISWTSADYINAGTKTLVIRGDGGYSGTVSAEYVINQYSFEDGDISFDIVEEYVYNGNSINPTVTVKDSFARIGGTEKTLVYDTDYTFDGIEYKGNENSSPIGVDEIVDAGEYDITVLGIGNYERYVHIYITVTPAIIDTVRFVVEDVEVDEFSATYKNEEIEPEVAVYAGDLKLEGSEFTVKYYSDEACTTETEVDPTNAGTYWLKVTSDSINFAGEVKKSFEITKAEINNITLVDTDQESVYNTDVQTIEIAEVLAGSVKVPTTEYEVTYKVGNDEITADEIKNARTYTVVVTAKTTSVNFTGTSSIEYTIKPKNIDETDVTKEYYYNYENGVWENLWDKQAQVYTGQLLFPKLTYKDVVLTPNSDYTFKYYKVDVHGGYDDATDFNNVGTYAVRIFPEGTNYTIENEEGCIELVLVNAAPFYSEFIKFETSLDEFLNGKNINKVYNGSAITISSNELNGFTATYNNKTPDDTSDDEILYFGTDFVIHNITLADGEKFEYTYTDKNGDEQTAEIEGVVGGFANNINAGKAMIFFKAINSNFGQEYICLWFTIDGKSIANSDISKPNSNYTFTYSGESHKDEIGIVLEDTNINYQLVSGTDYEVEYGGDFTNAGDATIIITGIGNYSGEYTINVTINPKEFNDYDFSYDYQESFAYDGNEHKVEPTIWFGTNSLTKGTHYTIEYYRLAESEEITNETQQTTDFTSNGVITMLIKGQGNFTGSIEKTYEIGKLTLGRLEVYVDGNINNSLKYTFDGEEHELTVEAYLNDDAHTKLNPEDFTVTFNGTDNNKFTNVGIIEIVVTSINPNYEGEITVLFQVLERRLSDDGDGSLEINWISGPTLTYNVATQIPSFTITDTKINYEMTLGTDFTVEYYEDQNLTRKTTAPTNAKTYYIKVIGAGNYNGYFTLPFVIAQKNIAELVDNSVIALGDFEYVASSIYEQVLSLKESLQWKTETLTSLTHFTYYYLNGQNEQVYDINVRDVDNYTLIVRGKGNYTGTISYKFNITPKNVEDINFTILNQDRYYNAGSWEPIVTATYNGENVINFVACTYSNNVNAGTATIKITANHKNYTGTKYITFTISKNTLTNAVIEISNNNVVYNGNIQTPVIIVKIDGKTLPTSDYKIEYYTEYNKETNVFEGKITELKNAETYYVVVVAQGNNVLNYAYTTYTIKPFTLTSDHIQHNGNEYIFTGSDLKPQIIGDVVIDCEEFDLVLNADYVIEWDKETFINADTYVLRFKGIGNFDGVVEITITINPRSLEDCEFVLNKNEYFFTGNKVDLDFTLTYEGIKLFESKDFVVEYYSDAERTISVSECKNTATYYARIVGQNNFVGTIDFEFSIGKLKPEVNIVGTEDVYVGDNAKDIDIYFSGTQGTISFYEQTIVSGDNVLTWKFIPDNSLKYSELEGTYTVTAKFRTTVYFEGFDNLIENGTHNYTITVKAKTENGDIVLDSSYYTISFLHEATNAVSSSITVGGNYVVSVILTEKANNELYALVGDATYRFFVKPVKLTTSTSGFYAVCENGFEEHVRIVVEKITDQEQIKKLLGDDYGKVQNISYVEVIKVLKGNQIYTGSDYTIYLDKTYKLEENHYVYNATGDYKNITFILDTENKVNVATKAQAVLVFAEQPKDNTVLILIISIVSVAVLGIGTGVTVLIIKLRKKKQLQSSINISDFLQKK